MPTRQRKNPESQDRELRRKKKAPDANAPEHDVEQQPDSATLRRAIEHPERATPNDILHLQRRAGNRAVGRLIQRKLQVGAANDRYEQEADRVANQVMSSQPSAVSRQPSVQRETNEESVQTKPLADSISPLGQQSADNTQLHTKRENGDGSFEAGGEFESRLDASRGAGSPLAENTRAEMESKFGADFSGVRVHTDADAVQLNREVSAQAFTHGSDIYLGEGKANVETSEGKQLLAHELTHVVQQRGQQSVPIQRKTTNLRIDKRLKMKYSQVEVEELVQRIKEYNAIDMDNRNYSHQLSLLRRIQGSARAMFYYINSIILSKGVLKLGGPFRYGLRMLQRNLAFLAGPVGAAHVKGDATEEIERVEAQQGSNQGQLGGHRTRAAKEQEKKGFMLKESDIPDTEQPGFEVFDHDTQMKKEFEQYKNMSWREHMDLWKGRGEKKQELAENPAKRLEQMEAVVKKSALRVTKGSEHKMVPPLQHMYVIKVTNDQVELDLGTEHGGRTWVASTQDFMAAQPEEAVSFGLEKIHMIGYPIADVWSQLGRS